MFWSAATWYKGAPSTCMYLEITHQFENLNKTYLYHENAYEAHQSSGALDQIKNWIIITGDKLGRVQFSTASKTYYFDISHTAFDSENLECYKQLQLMDEPIVAIEAREIVAMQSKKVFMAVASKMKFSIFELITVNGQIELNSIQTSLFDSEITSFASVSKNTR